MKVSQIACILAPTKVVQRSSNSYQILKCTWGFIKMKSLTRARSAVVNASAPMATCKTMCADIKVKGKYQSLTPPSSSWWLISLHSFSKDPSSVINVTGDSTGRLSWNSTKAKKATVQWIRQIYPPLKPWCWVLSVPRRMEFCKSLLIQISISNSIIFLSKCWLLP